MRLLLLATRILWRNRRRTLLTLSSLAVGQVLLIVCFSFFVAGTGDQIEKICQESTGHLQIQSPGFYEAPESGAYLKRPPSLAQLKRIDPNIVEERPRITFFGVVEVEGRQQFVNVRAVDHGRERPPLLVLGAQLDAERTLVPPYPALVGQLLARRLGVVPGDLMLITFLKADGKPSDVQCRVRGITSEGTPESDRRNVTVQIDVARRVLGFETGCHQQLIYLGDPDLVDRAVSRLSSALGDGARVMSWKSLNPQLRRLTRLTMSHVGLVSLTVVLTCLLGIAGVLAMSIADRVREFGLLSAVGMRPSVLFLCVTLEGAVLGVSTVLVASLVATSILLLLSIRGLDMTWMAGEAIIIDGVRADMVLRPRLVPGHFLWSMGMMMGTSLLASFWPAFRAARLDPLEAMFGFRERRARGGPGGPDERGEGPPGWKDAAGDPDVRPSEENAPAVSPVLKLVGVDRFYDGVAALRDIDLELSGGELCLVMGPSGSGKSTLLHLVGALDRPTAGEIRVCGQEIGRASREARSLLRLGTVGFVFQHLNLVPAFSLAENIELPLILQGWGATERRDRVRELGEALGIGDCLDRFGHQVSGGQLQRAAIARALSARPRLLLADEPTATLDSHNARQVLELIRDLVDRWGLAALVATHDTRLTGGKERLIRLVDGRIDD
ncbi:MAG: ATP-binding cassette domain-containing protein [Candidatus Riflebacteria bacterium]|nr:ATP-binding cassette domain-containing protein [Candidatus Riflebacteria bacterium]